MKVLSIRQPWAWAILHAGKDVENRDWSPRNPGLRFRGPFFIHAGLKADCEVDELIGLVPDGVVPPMAVADLPRGGIVGIAEVVDVVAEHPSRWFFGPVGLVLRNARPLPFTELKGQLGFFDAPGWTWPLAEMAA